MDFKDKLLIDFEDDNAEEKIKSLILEAGDDINKKYLLWNALDGTTQLCFKELFEDLKNEMTNFEDRAKLWTSTKYLVQMKNTDYFDELIELCEAHSINTKDSSIEFDVLSKTTKVITARTKELPRYLSTINEYAREDMLVEMLKFYDDKLKNLIGRDGVRDNYYKLIKMCQNDFFQNPTFEKAVLYNFKAQEMEIFDMSEELFSANPDKFLEALKFGTDIVVFGQDTVEAVVNREGANLPEDILDLINEINFSRELTNSLVHQKPYVVKMLLKRANDAIEDFGKEEYAYSLFSAQMAMLVDKPEFKVESKFRQEVLRALESCIEYGHITDNTDSLTQLYTSYKLVLNKMFRDYPIDNMVFGDIWDNLKKEIALHPAQIVDRMHNSVIDEFDASVFCNGLIELQQNDPSYRVDYTVNSTQYKKLLTAKGFPRGLTLDIVCANASEISISDLENSEGKFKCNTIRFADKNISNIQKHPYSIEKYKECREVIDDLIECVVMPPEDDPNRDKKIFMQIAGRLAYHIEYNYEYIEEAKKLGEEIKELKYKSASEISEEERSAKLMELRNKKEEMDIEARDLTGGLLYGTAVCAGYAEIVRNIMPFFGIEAPYIRGSKENSTTGHAWNQVLLDGVWYNADLTWARDELVKFDSSNYLLQDDKTFNTGDYNYINAKGEPKHKDLQRHDIYSELRSKEEKCESSVSPADQREFGQIDEEGITYGEWINGAANEITASDVSKAQKMMEDIMKSALKSQEDIMKLAKENKDGYDR